MRLQGQAKAGFFPCPPLAIEMIARQLSPTGPFSLLDPCAGEGAAVMQLAELLPGADPYAVELDMDRGDLVAERVRHHVTPCDFFQTSISHTSFDMAWVNPPYDNEMGGGGRVEQSFLQRVTPLLRPGGVLCFVVPERVVEGYGAVSARSYINERYDDAAMFVFPQECRKYGEVIVVAKRRKYLKRLDDYEIRNPPKIPLLDMMAMYSIPTGGAPRVFAKAGMTEYELREALTKSPLQRLLRPPKPMELAKPPLPLSRGHLAMLITAGQLDGALHPPGEQPHVIRGTCRKESYLKDQETKINEDGSESTKSVFGEKFVLTVRAVDQSGQMKSFE